MVPLAKTNLQFFKRVSLRERSLFTRAFATMIAAGLPEIKALGLLQKQTRNRYFQETLTDILGRLEEGEALSSAISRYPKIFDKVYVSSVKAAEASGKLEEILNELAIQSEKDYRLDSAIKGAIAYPAVIVSAMFFTGIILMVVVIPKFKTLFAESGVELPWSTRVLIGTAGFLSSYWYIILLVIIGAVIWLRFYLKSRAGQMTYGRAILKIPILKDFFVNVYMARFTRTLGMLVGAGVPIIEGVQIVSLVISNLVYEELLKKVAHQIERGIPMSSPISRAKEFPPIVSQMITVGEQTGKLDEIMTSLSKYFDSETDNQVKILSSLIEPILIFIVGLGVGVIVFAIIVPIYQISSVIK